MGKNQESEKKEVEVYRHLKFKEKNFGDVCKEIEFFKSLKLDKRREELKKLEDQMKGLEIEISANFESIEKAKIDLENAGSRKEAVENDYIEARERRQNAIALGEDDSEFKASITDLMVERDRIEDCVIGLERRIRNLSEEGDLLVHEKAEIERTILRFHLVPLVDLYNRKGGELVDVLKEIIVLSNQLGESFSEFRSGPHTVFFSDWEGIDVFAKLYLLDEIDNPENKWPNGKTKDLFNIKSFYEEIRQAREEV